MNRKNKTKWPMNQERRKYLLEIYKWFYQNNSSSNYNHPLYSDIHDIERIIIEGTYTTKDKELLNRLKDTVPWISKK